MRTCPPWIAECIRRLPSLTTLDTCFVWVLQDSSDSLLPHLPALRELKWGRHHAGPKSYQLPPPRRPVPEMGLRACAQMRKLHLTLSCLTDAQLCEIMPCMPHLESLSLSRMLGLHSLQFLASSPHLPGTLTELSLEGVYLPSRTFLSESCPIRSLRSLKQLSVTECMPHADLARVRAQLSGTPSCARTYWRCLQVYVVRP